MNCPCSALAAQLPSTRAEPESSQIVTTSTAVTPAWQTVRRHAAVGIQLRNSATPSAISPTSTASSASSCSHAIARDAFVIGPAFVPQSVSPAWTVPRGSPHGCSTDAAPYPPGFLRTAAPAGDPPCPATRLPPPPPPDR